MLSYFSTLRMITRTVWDSLRIRSSQFYSRLNIVVALFYSVVGIVKNSNYLGFSADFVIDFFSPSKLLLTNELMIDDHMYLVSTLQL